MNEKLIVEDKREDLDLSETERSEFVKPADFLSTINYQSLSSEEESSLSFYKQLPLSKIGSYSSSFEPLLEIFKKPKALDESRTGLYRVTVPKGYTLSDLAKFQNKDGYLGSVLKKNGSVGGGQAILNPVGSLSPAAMDPMMLYFALILNDMNKKLDKIEKTTSDILDFLVQKERAELKGDLSFLTEIIKNLKFNWNNDKYKNSNHIKVLDIKQSSERKINFYSQRVANKLKKGGLINLNKALEKDIKELDNEFKDYQFSMYLFSFASFVEVILLENFNKDYLQSIVEKIENYSFDYRDLYSRAYTRLESKSERSIENTLLKISGSLTQLTGESVNKIPLIKKSNLDKTLSRAGRDLKAMSNKKTDSLVESLLDRQNNYVRPFIENINELNSLYNKPIGILFDKENLYIELE